MSPPPQRDIWYQEWFGEEYLALYPHRDEEEAQVAVGLVLAVLGSPDGLVLDLACGSGRHMLELDERGLATIGLDLSAPLLAKARRDGPSLPLVRGDMRELPFEDGSFRLAVSFFTSFGYFADPRDDRRVLRETARVLDAGGAFVLDFLNAEEVRQNLVPRDERVVEGRRFVQTRALEENGRVISKTIRIFETDRDEPEGTYEERVRLYAPGELREMLSDVRLQAEHAFGDYDGSALTPRSPRCILMGHAS